MPYVILGITLRTLTTLTTLGKQYSGREYLGTYRTIPLYSTVGRYMLMKL